MSRHTRARMNIRPAHGGHRGDSRLERMLKHVYNSLRNEGFSDEEAVEYAARTVNKYRAARGITVEDLGRALARRHGWWPGWKSARELKGRRL